MLIVAIVLAATAVPPGPSVEARSEAYYHFSLAQQARLAQNLSEALDEYRKAQKLDPSSGAIRAETARLLKESGRSEEALPEAEAAVRLDPENADAHQVLAQILHGMAQATEDGEALLRRAAAEYEEVLRIRPRDVMTLFVLAGHVYPQLQDHDKAIAAWLRHLEVDPDNFESHVQLGTQYLLKGDAQKAAEVLHKAAEIKPTSARAYGALGDIYARAQQTDQAILNYRKALELEPRNLLLRIALAEVLSRARRHEEALGEAEAVLGSDAKNRFALDLKARSLRDLRRFDEAAAAADLLLLESPGDVKAGFLRVTIDEARRDLKAVVARIEALLDRPRKGEGAGESEASDRVLLVHLAFAYQQLERHRDAADAFARAAALPEAEPALLGQYVEALVLAGDEEKALLEVQAARRRFPDDTSLAAAEANVLRAKGQTEAGVAVVEALRRQAPKDVSVLADVAEFYQRAKRFAEAEEVLRSARGLEPRNVRVLFQLGATLERRKKPDAADAVFREALGIEPDSAPVLNYLGYMNADRGVKLQEAVTFIEKALALDPENGAYLDSLGWALFRLGRFGEAEAYLRQAVEKPGANAVVLDHLGDVLERRGSLQEAKEYWKKALQAEDDGEDLDRAAVERKIREAEAARNDGGASDRR